MKITDIEVIPIAMPLAKRYDNHHGRTRMYDIDQHVVVKIHTDNGLIGYGDYEDRSAIASEEIEPLIGRNPFDFLHNNFQYGSWYGTLRCDGQVPRSACL